VKVCPKTGGPPSKPKKYYLTNSEKYREGRVKSTQDVMGVKKNYKLNA